MIGPPAVAALAGLTCVLAAVTTAALAGDTAAERLPPPADGSMSGVRRIVHQHLRRARIPGDHDRLLVVYGGVVVIAVIGSPVLPAAPVVVAGVVLGPVVVVVGRRHAVAEARIEALPELAESIAAGLRAGDSVMGALLEVTVDDALEPEVEMLRRDLLGGVGVGGALERWRHAHPDPSTATTAAVLGVAALVGGPGARALDTAAALLRARRDARAESRAQAAQATASAAVLTLAPIAFAGVMTALDPGTGRFLFTTPIGLACLATGLALDAVGAWWMLGLIRRSR